MPALPEGASFLFSSQLLDAMRSGPNFALFETAEKNGYDQKNSVEPLLDEKHSIKEQDTAFDEFIKYDSITTLSLKMLTQL